MRDARWVVNDEGWWRADGSLSSLRRRVGANHRTLSTYVNALVRHGLRIEQMREPSPAAAWAGGTGRRPRASRCIWWSAADG